MQSDAYPQVEVSGLQGSATVNKVVNQIGDYVEAHYLARGYNPERITVAWKDYLALRGAIEGDALPVWRGIPIVNHRSAGRR